MPNKLGSLGRFKRTESEYIMNNKRKNRNKNKCANKKKGKDCTREA